jgi:2-dehydro-3-deoxyglucarate aldolase
MNRIAAIQRVRTRLRDGGTSIGTWMQIPHASVAEILGQAGYDWVVLDLEHGAICVHQLPDLCRALELGGTLPLARLAFGGAKECKPALDAGAGGVIIPMIESAEQLLTVRAACCWPPAGVRGVGFSRANLFGKHFQQYQQEAQAPLLVAMIEHLRGVHNLDAILEVPGLDAILIGPYDLSASLGVTGQFEDPGFASVLQTVRTLTAARGVPCGVHVVAADPKEVQQRRDEGYRFIAYSLDAVFLRESAACPVVQPAEAR